MSRRLLRRHGAAAILQRRLKWWTSMGAGAAMVVVAGLVCAYEALMIESDLSNAIEGHLHELDYSHHLEELGDSQHLDGYRDGRRLANVCDNRDDKGDRDSGYWNDPIIPMEGNPPRYRNSGAARWGIIVHVIVVAYMLLGLNTVCDLYFTGALQELVDKWQIKPDVAGATFMAAGGSAPELFTSLIGAVVTENDVGFGTIVGSAVFNVLAVIGACGVSALEPIPLTWWPLFRDCCYYIYGLALLAFFSYGKAIDCGDRKVGGGAVSLVEAIVLFLSYIMYCVLMYFNDRIEEFIKSKKDQVGLKRDQVEDVKSVEQSEEAKKVQSDGVNELRVSDHEDSKEMEPTDRSGLRSLALGDLESAPGPPEHHIGRDQAADQPSSSEKLEKVEYGSADQAARVDYPTISHHLPGALPGTVGNPGRIPSNNSGQQRSSSHNANKYHPEAGHQTIRVGKHHRVVYGPDGQAHHVQASPRPDGERRPSLKAMYNEKPMHSNHLHGAQPPAHSQPSTTLKVQSLDKDTVETRRSDMTQDSVDNLDLEKEGFKKAQAKDAKDEEELVEGLSEPRGTEKTEQNSDGGSTDSDDIEALMVCPDDIPGKIQWYLSLPIYAPLYYLIPRPDGEYGFVPTFCLSLAFIGGFSFLLVYCVELFGKAILGGGNNVTIVMSFTLLAAGTSIPDLVSSMAVARASQGDMAVSSSIGSNIFDILVGLPIPWIIKILFVDIMGQGKSYDESQVRIKSPYIALYVVLLLFMVFCVITSIHFLGWKLNFQLGMCMAILYLVFLAIVLPVELADKGPYL